MTKAWSHERQQGKDEWLTPPYIIRSLGKFDLDPCASLNCPWKTAVNSYTIKDDGLSQQWSGRVWLNPPYGRETYKWMQKLLQHGNGIGLIFARTETKLFFDFIWNDADALLFLKGRIKFCYPNGSSGDSAGAPSVLVAYGKDNMKSLQTCELNGKFIQLKDK